MNYPVKADDPQCPYPKSDGVKRLWSNKRQMWYTVRESDDKFVAWLGNKSSSTESTLTSEQETKRPRLLECNVVEAPPEPVDLELYEALQNVQYMLVSVQNILLGLIKKRL